jgi:hypothetical protein
MSKRLASIAAFLFYGGWALYSNWMDGSLDAVQIALRAGLIQGAYAALLTYVTMLILTSIFQRIRVYLQSGIANPVTVLITLSFQYLVIVPVHIINQTPNILLSLLPGMFIGGIFSWVYLHQHSKSM